MSIRRRLVVLAPALGLVACRAPGMPLDVHISRERIDEEIGRRFPRESRWLGLLDVVASRPRIELVPERNRIRTDVELSARDRLFSGRELRGSLTGESALRFEREDGTLRLAQVTVDQVGLVGVSEAVAAQMGRFGLWLGEQMLEGMVLHTLTDEQKSQLALARLTPGDITVTAEGVTVRLLPARD